MRFLQLGDAHLDSVIGGALGLPADKKAALRQDIRTAVVRACELAIEHKADLLLIPGDLFDYESLTPDTPGFLAHTFHELAPARVFIAPGNHDSLRPASPYLSASAWPENVHVFTAPEFETVHLPEIGCSITGIGHAHRGITDRLLADGVPKPASDTAILLFHGSRDGYRPSEKENVIPFSDAELLAQGFTYAALGHYHSFASITDANGRVRAAYSGCVQGRGLDEAGEKCVLLGEIRADGIVELQRVEVAPRRIVSVEANVTGAEDNAAALGRVEAAVDASGARECDVVHVALCGSLLPSVVLDTAALEASERFFRLVTNRSRIVPDYDLEALARESAASPLRSEFVRRMLDMRAQAATPDEERALLDATYYGLSALDGRKLEPRDAD